MTKTMNSEIKVAASSETTIAASAATLKKKSAGQKIRDIFAKLLVDKKITADVVKILVDTEQTKKVLNIRYAFLKEATKNVDRFVEKYARYINQIIEVNGKFYDVWSDDCALIDEDISILINFIFDQKPKLQDYFDRLYKGDIYG